MRVAVALYSVFCIATMVRRCVWFLAVLAGTTTCFSFDVRADDSPPREALRDGLKNISSRSGVRRYAGSVPLPTSVRGWDAGENPGQLGAAKRDSRDVAPPARSLAADLGKAGGSSAGDRRTGWLHRAPRAGAGLRGRQAGGRLPPGSEGDGPFPAVFVPFYEPLTSIGQSDKGRGTHDYGLQLVKRGFVTLSIGTPGSFDKIGGDTRRSCSSRPAVEHAPAAAHAPGLCRGQLPHGAGANARGRSGADRHHRPLLRRQVVDVRLVPVRQVRLCRLVRSGHRLQREERATSTTGSRGISATIRRHSASRAFRRRRIRAPGSTRN